MPTSQASADHMKRIFAESFSVADIAEPLASFDAVGDAARVEQVMRRRGFEVAGVREGGVIAGYVRRAELTGGTVADHLLAFDGARVVPDSAGFASVVQLLSTVPRIFVTTFGQIGGIATRSDLQKPPVRMWLFGMVSLIEMGLMRAIETRYPNDTWKRFLSEGRLQKAEELLAERKRRNQDLDLLDCLQFSDKGQISLKDETLRKQIGYESRRRGEDTIKQLESLRNNLAHAQDIVTCNWDIIVRLTENLDKVFASGMSE